MVHALKESWRVLQAGGRLIDIRPHVTGWPVELVSRHTRILAGQLEDKKVSSADSDSDFAMAEAVDQGLFRREHEEFFEYAYHWDTVEQMRDYVTAKWPNSTAIPDKLLPELRHLLQRADKQVQICIRRTMLASSYQKIS